MNKTIPNIVSAIILGLLLITVNSTLVAQTEVQSTTSKTTNSAGTITTFSPDTIAIRTITTSDPVSYAYTRTTTYVDENGAPVSMTLVKSGLPVTVYYVQDGDRMIASKVIVRRVLKKEAAAPVIEEKRISTTTTTDQ
jgi:hypothetical protein